ncbi:MAG TPA: glycosyltransferase family 39 protein [Candidatus Omnitrophota bacterium]|nr:glycosyltransferase family 39 protein [Candidatus Omnitrophota bacterium]HPS37309.1 glycosyltransferase family 39 protein [Candidatus Omnitrophota bacterium]
MTERTDSNFRNIFWLVATATFAAMPLLSFHYGITWDEWIQSQYGKLVLRFFLSGGTARECLTFENLYLYGGLFDTLAVTVYGFLFGGFRLVRELAYAHHFTDLTLPFYYETRHVLNALLGAAGILFTGLIAKELRGWRTGLLALLLILLSPRFFGNSMNNPKDIPFAMAYAMSLYALLRFFKVCPNPGWRSVLFLIFSIAIAINIKAGGLILLCYLLFFPAFGWIRDVVNKKQFFFRARPALLLLGIASAAYLAGLLLWPFGLLDPVHNPLRTLEKLSHFTGFTGVLLFEGKLIPSTQTPWYYLPKWILISVPLYIHLGLLLWLFFWNDLRKIRNISLLAVAAFFPLAYAILNHSTVYDSWRHFLFIYPPLVVLAAVTWDQLFSWVKNKIGTLLILFFLCLNLLEPVVWMVRCHPNEYVYFNPLVGGLRGAYGRYDTDYWGNSLKEASEWLTDYYKRHKMKAPIRVRWDGELISSAYYLIRGLGPSYLVSDDSNPAWDFWLSLSRKAAPQRLQNGEWPPRYATIHTVETDGVPLCAIVKNPLKRISPEDLSADTASILDGVS